MAEERIGTGLPNLDKIIEGGFKIGSVNLVAGNAGAGKTTLAMQFIVQGLKNGEAGIFITLEENKDKLFSDFSAFGWNLEEYERSGQLRILQYTPEQIKRQVAEGGGTLDVLVGQMNAKRIVIDSVTSFSMLFINKLARREASLGLFDLFSRWGCTAVLTSEATKVSADEIEAEMEFEVDGIIVLHHFKKKGTRERGLEVLKMRGTKTPEKTMKMDITEKGVIVDPNKVVSI